MIISACMVSVRIKRLRKNDGKRMTIMVLRAKEREGRIEGEDEGVTEMLQERGRDSQ